MKAGATTVNGHGVPVSLHRCADCGRSFTVTPAADSSWGLGCLTDDCPSYDLSRDVDIFFEPMAEAGLVHRGAAL